MKHLLFFLLASLAITGSQAQYQRASAEDSTRIGATIMDFYNWYLENPAKLNSFELYRGVKVKDQPPYKIDWKEADKYFAFIRSSVPQLGEEFIKNQRAFLKKCDSAFKADLDGDVPYGFDYDWYTNSQEEASYLVDEIKKSPKWNI